MDIETLSAVCMTLILLGVLVSAYFWNKQPKLRLAPVAFSVLAGCLYVVAVNSAISGFLEALKMIGLSTFIGIGFYFTVWIQCSEVNELRGKDILNEFRNNKMIYFWIFVPLVFLFVSAILECEYGEITDWVYISLILVSSIAMIVRTFRKSSVRYAEPSRDKDF